MIDLTEKAALVTGGASGIGRGICLVLAQQGASVVVADTNGPEAESVAAEVSSMGRESLPVVVDVTDRPSVNDMVTQVLEAFGGIDILVNDAGVIGAPNWWERKTASDADWDHVMAVNVRGLVIVSEAVAPRMKERRYGKIVNIASTAARRGSPYTPHYHASKAAVVSWTQSHALQLAPYDINVNAICPGYLWTPMWERLAQFRSTFHSEPSTAGLTGGSFSRTWWSHQSR